MRYFLSILFIFSIYYGNHCPGDTNLDHTINIQDVILIVNLILTSQFDASGDLNSDNQLNIQDVILLVNLILN